MRSPTSSTTFVRRLALAVGLVVLAAGTAGAWAAGPGRVLEITADRAPSTAELEALGGEVVQPWTEGLLQVRLAEELLAAAASQPWVVDARLLPASGPELTGFQVYLDPATGLPTTPPVGERTLTYDGKNASDTQVSDLAAERMPDGSLRLNLAGRFRNYLVASADEDQPTTASCSTHSAGSHETVEQEEK